MDIKDFILIGGGILIAMVVGHGFWIAWRAKREPLRMDIVPDLIPDDVDEIERLRGELPNGGARVVTRRKEQPAQENLAFEEPAPTLMDPVNDPVQPGAANHADPGSEGGAGGIEPRVAVEPPKNRPRVRQAPPRKPVQISTVDSTRTATTGAEVKEVDLGDDLLTTPSRGRQNKTVEAVAPVQKQVQKKVEKQLQRQSRTQKDTRARNEPQTKPPASPVEELLVINLLAPRSQRFGGEDLVNALRAQGLRYGDMNIFHRVDPATKGKLYSVANAVEPGTFDLADLDSMQSPGMTFFLQLPGPDDASGAFEDMLSAARQVSLALGGELRDEALSALSGQATEHMRQRIADYARRRLSKRA